ncbi:hypothetical protein CPAR01_08105 [Colletotrichum paranaense]|uniref:Uncharacterized protein n=2 Tax=Colletotrichum acutatum species complex TaxID=2707335 RepID=A0AAI9XMP3_9PEZI|nr:uncharacterized protein CPAR01_08105 [Colletotrichum paranaense]KAK1453541.1 hypothetical protein CMEL01_05200 [Colletotrichum melonis]KAK1537992.1 hypothetical protein CPAR01_08105 [Colletotrichum paranaense]
MPTQGIVDTDSCPCIFCLRVFVWKVLSGQREIVLLHPCLRKKNDAQVAARTKCFVGMLLV